MTFISLPLLFTILGLILTPLSLGITLLIFIALIGILIILSLVIPRYRFPLLFMIVGMTMGIIVTLPLLVNYQKAVHLLPITDTFHVSITQNNPNYSSLRASIVASDYPKLREKEIYIYDVDKAKTHFKLNEVYSVKLKLSTLNSAPYPTNETKRLHYLSRFLIGNATPLSDFTLEKGYGLLTKLRLNLHDYFMSHNFSKNGYLSALSVGITENLETKDWDLLRKTGTIHLVSISGLHLTFIALWSFILIRTICGLLLIKKIEPYKIAAITAIIIALGYALLAGFSLPTQRALIMFCIAMMGLLTFYPILSFHSLAFALVLILLITPLSALTIGMWLSFTAVCLLILLNRFRFHPLYLLLFTQLMVSLVVMPFTASYFAEISLISPIANFFAIPWTTIFILPSLLIGIILLPIFPTLSHLFFKFSNHCLEFMLFILEKLNHFPFASLLVPKIPFIIALFITILILLFISVNTWRQRSYLVFCLVAILTFYAIPKRETFQLHLFPVGEGLSVLLQSPNQTILFDTGLYFRLFDAGARVIVPSLNYLGITALDYIFLSKNNQQHTGGTRSVRNHYPNANMVVPSSIKHLVNNSVQCDNFSLKNTYFKVTQLVEIKSSCGYLVTFSDKTLWLIGDITANEWQLLLDNYTLPDILLFPNQGRSRYFNIDFLSHENRDSSEQSTHPLTKNHPKKVPLLLFSTKYIATHYEPFLSTLDKRSYANAYYGWIRIKLSDKNLRINHFTDAQRFWWMCNPP